MKTHANPLLNDAVCPTADLESVTAPTVFRRRRGPSHRRTIRDLRRQQSATEAVAGLDHAKFALIRNAAWQIVIQTSMNLNFNPRFENFSLAHDPELFAFYQTILDEVWRRQPRELAAARPYEIHKHFADEL